MCFVSGDRADDAENTFHFYYNSRQMLEKMGSFIKKNPVPGIIRYIALVPEQKISKNPLKHTWLRFMNGCFVFSNHTSNTIIDRKQKMFDLT